MAQTDAYFLDVRVYVHAGVRLKNTGKDRVYGRHVGPGGRTWGLPGWMPVQMCIDEANKAGGINGHRIQLVIKDDRHRSRCCPASCSRTDPGGCGCNHRPHDQPDGHGRQRRFSTTATADALQSHHKVSTQTLLGIDDYFFRRCTFGQGRMRRSAPIIT